MPSTVSACLCTCGVAGYLWRGLRNGALIEGEEGTGKKAAGAGRFRWRGGSALQATGR
jgi:hypothetical protein